MANEQNLIPFTSDQDREEAKKNGRKGGIASGEVRREKATMKKTLEMLLDVVPKKIGDKENIDKKTWKELATLGLIAGAVQGNATNYRTMLETIGELTSEGSGVATPTLKIEVSDNSKLEKVLYEENRHSKDDEVK
jgi:general stress protein YciG